MIEWRKSNDALGTSNRGNPCESGLCTLCDSACKGKCETWLASLRGRELLYPRRFGFVTAGSANVVALGLGYHALRIQGYAYGWNGGRQDPDLCLFPHVDVSTRFGRRAPITCRAPLMTGALGSTFIAAKYWDSFAIGAALSGIPIVVGENVVGVDKQAVIKNGRIERSPELDRRVQAFLRYYDGHGAIMVQMNVEDARNGVAEYLIDRFGDQMVIELKWGQGAKSIGGEIQVDNLEYARMLKQRGYLLDPDPDDPAVQEAFRSGALRSFARHSRLGASDLASPQEVMEAFWKQVQYLRSLGYKRITLKTGSYGMEALALAIRCASETELDLLTIDGSGGGTGMSPWNMMEHWGVPSLLLHSRAYEYAKLLANRGKPVVDLAFAGGLAREDHVFKALALGAPYAKLVCMGRAMMIPAFVGSNIEGVLRPERKAQVNGQWDELPPTVSCYGNKPEQIFVAWEAVARKVGTSEMSKIPFGAVAMYALVDKITAGLQQFMAGARKANLSQLSRSDLIAANRETALETGIPFATEAEHDRALAILQA